MDSTFTLHILLIYFFLLVFNSYSLYVFIYLFLPFYFLEVSLFNFLRCISLNLLFIILILLPCICFLCNALRSFPPSLYSLRNFCVYTCIVIVLIHWNKVPFLSLDTLSIYSTPFYCHTDYFQNLFLHLLLFVFFHYPLYLFLDPIVMFFIIGILLLF